MKTIVILLALASAPSNTLEKADAFRENGLNDESRKVLIEIAYTDGYSRTEQEGALRRLRDIARGEGNNALADKIDAEMARRFPTTATVVPADSGQRPTTADVIEERNWPENPSRIRLLSAGQSPRIQVRYDLDLLEEGEFDLTILASGAKGGCPSRTAIPLLDLNMRIQINSIERIGRDQIRVKWDGTASGTLEGRSTTNPVSGSLIFGPTGRPTLSQSQTDTTGFFKNYLIEWPETPIGQGASWEVEVANPLVPDQRTIHRYTVVEISRDQLSLNVETDGNIRAKSGFSRASVGASGAGTITWSSAGVFPMTQKLVGEGEVSHSRFLGIGRAKHCMSFEFGSQSAATK